MRHTSSGYKQYISHYLLLYCQAEPHQWKKNKQNVSNWSNYIQRQLAQKKKMIKLNKRWFSGVYMSVGNLCDHPLATSDPTSRRQVTSATTRGRCAIRNRLHEIKGSNLWNREELIWYPKWWWHQLSEQLCRYILNELKVKIFLLLMTLWIQTMLGHKVSKISPSVQSWISQTHRAGHMTHLPG